VGDDALLLRLGDVARDRLGIEGRWIDVKTFARLQQLAHEETDHERERRHGFEIDEGLDADAAYLLEVADRADAVNHGAKDHRRDHHLDQGDEAVPQGLESRPHGRPEVPYDDAGADRYQELDVEDRVPGATRLAHWTSR
jgi:hypothetical protein